MRRESGVDEVEIEEVGIAQGQIVNTQWLSFKRRDLSDDMQHLGEAWLGCQRPSLQWEHESPF
jgi:hypothetical protein